MADINAKIQAAIRELGRCEAVRTSGRGLNTTVAHVRERRHTIYVGRGCCPVTGQLGQHGNPYPRSMGRRCLELYFGRALLSMAEAGTLESHLAPLRDQVLGCWCGSWAPGGPPLVCHAVGLALLCRGLVLADARETLLEWHDHPRGRREDTLDLFPVGPGS